MKGITFLNFPSIIIFVRNTCAFVSSSLLKGMSSQLGYIIEKDQTPLSTKITNFIPGSLNLGKRFGQLLVRGIEILLSVIGIMDLEKN